MIENKIRLLNINLANVTIDELLRECSAGIIFPMNIDTMVTLQEDEEYYNACFSADYLTIDSQIMFFLLNIFGNKIKAKVAGSDFFPAFCGYHKNNESIKIFVLGGIGDVSKKVEEILNRQAKRQLVVGNYSPSFGFDKVEQECDEIIHRINKSEATVVAVGVGAPKQEKWINTYRSRLPKVRIFIAVGATLDFIAKKEQRAPGWMQKIGLEWFYRMMKNPQKMVKRYLIRDLRFFYYFILDKVKLYHRPFVKD
jgi:N-acetylglucosaminyldiphosphoundecaprenol N-acetyl-beta-D-mannosaminyltransferase